MYRNLFASKGKRAEVTLKSNLLLCENTLFSTFESILCGVYSRLIICHNLLFSNIFIVMILESKTKAFVWTE